MKPGDYVDVQAGIPEGYVLLLIPREMAEAHAEWRECCAVRIRTEGETVASLEVTNDMDWLTSPEAEDG